MTEREQDEGCGRCRKAPDCTSGNILADSDCALLLAWTGWEDGRNATFRLKARHLPIRASYLLWRAVPSISFSDITSGILAEQAIARR